MENVKSCTWQEEGISQREASRRTGLSRSTIFEILKSHPDLRHNFADFEQFVRERERDRESLEEARRRKAVAVANRCEIAEKIEAYKLKEIEESTYSREYVITRVADIGRRFSDLLFSLPARVSSAMMGAETEDEARQILDLELRKITREVEKWKI